MLDSRFLILHSLRVGLRVKNLLFYDIKEAFALSEGLLVKVLPFSELDFQFLYNKSLSENQIFQ
jgi:hypothetical protein